MQYYTFIRNWSEAWAFLIPLAIIIWKRDAIPQNWSSIKKYIIIGLVINTVSTILFVFHKSLPPSFPNNNILYNIHSVIRVLFFSWFLSKCGIFHSNKLFKIVLSLYAVFIVVNFTVFQSFLKFSTPLFIAETIVLIIFCTSYFYHGILSDEAGQSGKPVFLFTSGLFIFEAINFFIYLFYGPVGENLSIELKRMIWSVHNFSLVAFCIVIAVALYKGCIKKE